MLPEMIPVKQHFPDRSVADIPAQISDQLARFAPAIRPESRIAITAGSRGMDRISIILRSVVRWIKQQGGRPFVVPAMGSHGGATAEGQTAMLAGLGITEESVEAPIFSSMEVTEIGRYEDMPVCLDRHAAAADGIIVVNRIKPHTSLHGEIESGLMKMMAIGLGKAVQAQRIHSLGLGGLRTYIAPLARHIINSGKIIAGLGLVENSCDRVMQIEALSPQEIEDGEKKLLVLAKAALPRLPVNDLDVLVVEEMGKNISGTGMDTNIIGRLRIPGEPEPETPRIRRIVVLDLTLESHGNALGIGLADITTRALFAKIDFAATYANVLTTTFVERGKIPLLAKDEQEAVAWALETCGVRDIAQARVIRIKNTLTLQDVWVSPAVWQEIQGQVERRY
jgi:hypothetical protein